MCKIEKKCDQRAGKQPPMGIEWVLKAARKSSLEPFSSQQYILVQ